ncbi:MAG: DUF4442 domain-containing protein [Actinomycetia bacterium]|jgi:acyl-coenzyme A thioesterase PaaI-like protein|nr:DUF4442 domain-containing protein [Actinomycetes bacterium]
MDPHAAAEWLRSAVPFVHHLGLEFLEVQPTRAVLRLPDQPAFHNHVGGLHAGAMFTLGESASGAVVLASFGDLLDRATPLPTQVEMRFLKVALGPVTAEAVLGRPVAEVLAELDAGTRPEFPVAVTVRTDDGTVTSELSITWTLRPNR